MSKKRNVLINTIQADADIDNDDMPVGHILNRREVLSLLATVTAGALVACTPAAQSVTNTPVVQAGTTPSPTGASSSTPAGGAATASPTTGAAASTPAGGNVATPTAAATTGATPTAAAAAPTITAQIAALNCIVRPAQTEGPYFVDTKLNRLDIRSNTSDNAVKQGVPLTLSFRVTQISSAGCTPLPNAQVDIWHCDAAGAYSGAQDQSSGNNRSSDFLRGYQIIGSDGVAKFTTIYPGWYPGRAVHIHFKIRTNPGAQSGREFTSQLYFDDTLSDEVFRQAPYSSRGQRNTRNNNDGLYRQGGSQLLLNLTKEGEGYASTFDIGLQMS